MSDRAPAYLVVFVETAAMRWHVAAIDQAGRPLPLLQSEAGDLNEYRGQPSDEQVSFLRHRLAGALQRGCERLYFRKMKAAHFLIFVDAPLPHTDDGVTQRLAEHFVQWMVNPPATFLTLAPPAESAAPSAVRLVAGELPASIELPAPIESLLDDAIAELATAFDKPECWELMVPPQKSKD